MPFKSKETKLIELKVQVHSASECQTNDQGSNLSTFKFMFLITSVSVPAILQLPKVEQQKC